MSLEVSHAAADVAVYREVGSEGRVSHAAADVVVYREVGSEGRVSHAAIDVVLWEAPTLDETTLTLHQTTPAAAQTLDLARGATDLTVAQTTPAATQAVEFHVEEQTPTELTLHQTTPAVTQAITGHLTVSVTIHQTTPAVSQSVELTVTLPGELTLHQTAPAASQAVELSVELPAVEATLHQTTPSVTQAVTFSNDGDITVTIGPIDIAVTPQPVAAAVVTPPTIYPNPADEPGWSGRVMDGLTVLADLPDISVQDITWDLNRPSSASVMLPKGSAASLAPGRELQLFWNDALMFWGPVTGIQADAKNGPVMVSLADPMWYLERSFFGTAQRLNLFENGGFEGGYAPWGPVNLTAAHVTTGAILRGSGAVALYGRTDPNAYITQTQVYEHAWPFGQRITVSAWCHISDGDWQGPAVVDITDDLGNRQMNPGLMVLRRTYPGGEIARVAVAEITDDTPRDQWVRLETHYTVEPHQLGTLECRLYGVDGTIRWDEQYGVKFESTSGDPDGNDQAELVRRIVTYTQTGRGKATFNLGTDTPATGVTIPLRAWQHADHEPIMGAIREFVDTRDGMDISVEITPTTRTFTTHYPMKGADRTDLVLRTKNEGGQCAGFGYQVDIGRTANSVVILGPSHGPSREEGGAIDTEALGGLVLESVLSAQDGTPIRQLDEIAAEELRARKHPVEVLEVEIHDRTLVGVLSTGDLVSVDFDDGVIQASGVWRVVRLRLDASDDHLFATLNAWESE